MRRLGDRQRHVQVRPPPDQGGRHGDLPQVGCRNRWHEHRHEPRHGGLHLRCAEPFERIVGDRFPVLAHPSAQPVEIGEALGEHQVPGAWIGLCEEPVDGRGEAGRRSELGEAESGGQHQPGERVARRRPPGPRWPRRGPARRASVGPRRCARPARPASRPCARRRVGRWRPTRRGRAGPGRSPGGCGPGPGSPSSRAPRPPRRAATRSAVRPRPPAPPSTRRPDRTSFADRDPGQQAFPGGRPHVLSHTQNVARVPSCPRRQEHPSRAAGRWVITPIRRGSARRRGPRPPCGRERRAWRGCC